MSRYFPRRLISPVLLLVMAAVLRNDLAGLQPVYLPIIGYAPYALLGVVAALCIYYDRARLFIATLSAVVVYYLIQTQLQSTLARPDTLVVYSLISVLHPLGLLFLLCLPERGLLNRYGLLLLTAFLLLIAGAALAMHLGGPALLELIETWLPAKAVTGLVLSLPAIACYLLAMAAGFYCLARRRDEYALMLVSICLFTLVTLAKLNLSNISTVMFVAMSVSLLIGMLGTSYDMAFRDELSGLLGRRALNHRLRGLGKQYVIAMIDVDHFKKFNDTHGHDIGDEVLKMVARQIAAVKGGGTAYRYGGEEFSVIFAGRDIEYCLPFLEQVRQDIEDYRLTVRDKQHRPRSKKAASERRGRRARRRSEVTAAVTVSIGLAEPDSAHRKPEDVLKSADAALYKAKNSGRNCIAC